MSRGNTSLPDASRLTAARFLLTAHGKPGCLVNSGPPDCKQETHMRSILLWLLGIPIPIIILIALLT